MPFWSDPTIKPKQAFRWVISFGGHDYINTTEDNANAVLSFAAKSVTKPSYTIKSNKYKLLGSHAFNYPTSLEWQPITIKFVDIWGFGIKDKPFYTKQTIIEDKKALLILPENESLKEHEFYYEEYVGLNNESDKLFNSTRSIQQFFYTYLAGAGYVAPYEGNTNDKLLRYRSSLYKEYAVDALTLEKNGTDGNSFIEIKELNDSGLNIETWELYNPFISKVSFGDLSYENENLVEITVEIQYDWALLKPFNHAEADSYKKITDAISLPLKRAKQYQDEETKLTRDNIINSYIDGRQALIERGVQAQAIEGGKQTTKTIDAKVDPLTQLGNLAKPLVDDRENIRVKNGIAISRRSEEFLKLGDGKLSLELLAIKNGER
jgi:hypothetical protein